ncbi:flagellar basal body L-ring protein FlgH [Amaricoccus sp.]|uniref:flagellar basal body L-ring protein FlgH n=1 Tax=Amaricoccus sp. TaxID=1872485 RepID=UPI001B4FA0E9|nr:flagellar basal body L-ring protein FlgH [Amaricoccus sp.]MBP7240733.1 flagellar basal body L-ring protein FlgH [Amaricoccus sp.]
MKAWIAGLGGLALLAACGGDNPIGQPPPMTTIGSAVPGAPAIMTAERAAIAVPPPQAARHSYQQASLWGTGQDNLLGDRRARNLGDLLTIVIEIDDEAEMKNSTQRNRRGSEGLEIGEVFGISGTKLMPRELGGLTGTLEVGGESSFRGNGNVKRNEKLTLRIAATVIDVLPNGHLVVQGDQEVRVNNELRDLQIVGIVQPEDISRYNVISYDRIAGARISYGGRGTVSTAQQPRWGQQAVDKVLPF